MRTSLAALLLSGLVVGCAANPAIKVETQIVKVPVPVRCPDKALIPAEPARVGKLPDDARRAADLLGAKVIELRQSFRRAAALLDGCAG